MRLRSFRRVVPLPVPVVANNSKASYEQGVLKIELTKAKQDKPKMQTIKANLIPTCGATQHGECAATVK